MGAPRNHCSPHELSIYDIHRAYFALVTLIVMFVCDAIVNSGVSSCESHMRDSSWFLNNPTLTIHTGVHTLLKHIVGLSC